MKSLLLTVLLLTVLTVKSDDEGCRWPFVTVSSGYYAQNPVLHSGSAINGSFGSVYLPIAYNYCINVAGNIGCNYSLKSISVYKDEILLFKVDTFCFGYMINLGAFPGHYKVNITWSNPVALSLSFDIQDSPTPVGDFSANDRLVFISDKTQDKLILQSEEHTICRLRLLDLTGKLIYESNEQLLRYEIPTENLPAGVYLVQAMILNERIIIKKILLD